MNRGVGLAVGPPLIVVVLVLSYGVDVPYWDTWAWLDRHYPAGARGAGDLLAAYWHLFNEHRVFLSLVLDRLVLEATGGNMLVRALLKVPLAAATLWLMLRLAARTLPGGRPAWLPVALSCLAFPLTYWPMWIDPRQFSIHLVHVAMGVAIVVASGGLPLRWRLVGSSAACIAATISYGPGLFTWPFVALTLVSQQPRPSARALSLWMVPGGVLLVLQVLDLVGSGTASPGGAARGAVSMPLDVVVANLALLGLPVAPVIPQLSYLPTVLVGTCGLTALAWCWFSAQRSRLDRARATPWLALGGWAVVTAVAAAAGRASLPVGALQDPRFVPFTAPLWMALAVLAVMPAGRLAEGDAGAASRRPGAGMAVGVVAALYLVACLRPFAAPGGPTRLTETLRAGERCLREYEAADDQCLAVLHPSAAYVRTLARRLGPERLRALRQRPPEPDKAEPHERGAVQ